MNTQMKTSLLALCIGTALSACGGGGGGALPGTTAAAKPAVTVSGSVSGFGSVIVNGVRYETTGSRLVSDDTGETIIENPTDDQLQALIGLGEVINLRGGRDDTGGVATTIIVDNELVGPITAGSIQDASLTFKVLGQTISVSSTTIIDDTLGGTAVDEALGTRALTSILVDGTVVEISGHPGANGIEATRIESSAANVAGGEAEVKGTVSAVTATTFDINDLTVSFTTGTPGASNVATGKFVEVKGSFDGTNLNASSIQLEDDNLDEGEVEVEGVIQSIEITAAPAGKIKVNGFEFSVADVSQYSVGMKIEIKAQNTNGTLSVTRIQDETEDSIRIKDKATGPAVGNDISTRLGLTISMSDRSRVELERDNGSETTVPADFLAGIQNGTYIEARGFQVNGNIVWTRIEASEDSKEQCRLRGPVSNISAGNSFDIQNVTVSVATSIFKAANGTLLDNATFFSELADGIVVEAKSPSNGAGCSNDSLAAKEVSFEPGDDVLENNGGNDDGNDANGNDVADNELTGAVSNITATTFDIEGETITVNTETMIDNSILEDFRNVDNIATDLPFDGVQVTETLAQLLTGPVYVVTVDRTGASPVATLIEDF